MGLGSIVVKVMDSHPCDRDSNTDQGNHIYIYQPIYVAIT